MKNRRKTAVAGRRRPATFQGVPPGTRRVLICPDKFKGTLTATEAAAAMAAGWRRARPHDVPELLPISDGGDGFGELLGRHLGAQLRHVRAVDAAHRPVRAAWWWLPAGRLAIVESARVVGLAMLPPGQYHPFELDSLGLGRLIRTVGRLRPRRWIVGLGGSATNDAGFGLALGLGWRFLDAQGLPLSRWPELVRLASVRPPTPGRLGGEVEVAVDVRNPLLGPRGATRVYGPQKGVRPEDVPAAEAAHRRLARVLGAGGSSVSPLARLPGAGAAGGLGFGMATFAGGTLVSGFALFARAVGLEDRIRQADLVLTGEGAIDETSVSMGKGVGGVGRLARRLGKPCLAFGGSVAVPGHAGGCFTETHAITPDLTSPAEARREAAHWLETLVRRVAAAWPR